MQDTLRYRYLFFGSSYRNIVAGVFMTTQKSVLHKVATKWKKKLEESKMSDRDRIEKELKKKWKRNEKVMKTN